MITFAIFRKGAVRGVVKLDDDNAHLLDLNWREHKGYAVRSVYVPGVGKRNVPMHREVLGLGAYTGQNQVDHINGDKLDNRRANLRIVDASTNQHNRRSPNAGRALPLGVYWMPRINRFKAEIRVRGESRYLGTFLTAQAASDAVENERRALGLSAVNLIA